METEILQKKYDRLYEKVRTVRNWQRQYRKYYVIQDKQMMIMHERQLDNMIALEDINRKKNQKELF